jgi:branched-chain amino acid transport system substrate-binding protein
VNSKNIVFICLIICSFTFLSCSDSATVTLELEEIEIGALIPLTGEYKNSGMEILAALNCAVEDINKTFTNEKRNTRIKLVYSDTRTEPSSAKEKIQSFLSQDIRIIIGPLTSTEVNGVKDDINSSNSLLISPSSTLTALAVANDNIYRVVPDDSKMVEATVDVMWAQGIRSIAMLYLDNAWGQSFISQLRVKFEAKGGTYLGDVPYIGSRESELKEYLNELSAVVSPAVSNGDPSTVAIQMISLDVGSFLLDIASTFSTFSKVKWFGCDGFVNSDELFSLEEGVKFANKVNFTSPIFGTPSNEQSQSLIERISAVTQSTPNQYSLLAYDALIAAAKTLDEVGSNGTLSQLKEKLELILAKNSGVTGNIQLNDAGDRDNGSYFFWQIVEDGDSYKWEHTITCTNGVIE